MNKTTLLTVSVVGLLLLNAGMLVFMFTKRPPQGPPHGEGRGGAADFIVQQLKLDDKQQGQFAELRKQHRDQMDEVQEADKELHRNYFDLLKQDSADMKAVDSMAAVMGETNKKIQLITYNHFKQLRSICNAEQKKLFDNTIDEIIHFMMPPPGGGKQQGPPPR
jgi:periplasmic protein CpxP/Spy